MGKHDSLESDVGVQREIGYEGFESLDSRSVKHECKCSSKEELA